MNGHKSPENAVFQHISEKGKCMQFVINVYSFLPKWGQNGDKEHINWGQNKSVYMIEIRGEIQHFFSFFIWEESTQFIEFTKSL